MTIPSVPSAPMKSFVVSNPVEDLRARRRVLMTSPLGSTTVCRMRKVSGDCVLRCSTTYDVEEPLAPRRAIPHGICCSTRVMLGFVKYGGNARTS